VLNGSDDSKEVRQNLQEKDKQEKVNRYEQITRGWHRNRHCFTKVSKSMQLNLLYTSLLVISY